MRAKLTLGDWSHDGHNQTDTIDINIVGNADALTGDGCPLVANKTWGCSSYPNLWAYYRKGVEVTGHDVTKYCTDYEDSYIPAQLVRDLIPDKFGDYVFSDDEEDEVDEVHEAYVDLWIAIVNAGIAAMNIDAQVVIVAPDVTLNYNIGGYGLFN